MPIRAYNDLMQAIVVLIACLTEMCRWAEKDGFASDRCISKALPLVVESIVPLHAASTQWMLWNPQR